MSTATQYVTSPAMKIALASVADQKVSPRQIELARALRDHLH
jgi:hypothetical protein